MAAYLEEVRHRLVGAADLDTEVGGLAAVAVGRWTLDRLFLCIVPCLGPAKHVLLFLAREVLARVDGLLDGVLVRAGAALDSVAARLHAGEDEEVGAVRADYGWLAAVEVTWECVVGECTEDRHCGCSFGDLGRCCECGRRRGAKRTAPRSRRDLVQVLRSWWVQALGLCRLE